MATYEKKLIFYQLKKGFHSGPVILILFAEGIVTDQKCPRPSPKVAIKDLLDGSQHTPLSHEGVRTQ